ncbi:MAG: calcium-binding protein [Alphaproteobacteria bacterium]|nr:calcium-binding protein [Alphaproteobacteria bacterium]
MANAGANLFDGYQDYFSFTTGFKPQAEIASTTFEVVSSFEGYKYIVTFADNSRIEFRLPEKNSPENLDPPGFDNVEHYHFALSGGFRILDQGGDINFKIFSSTGALVLDSQTQAAQPLGNVSIFSPDFVETWFDGFGFIAPNENETIHGDQVIHGWGGQDNLYGGSGDDTIFLDKSGLTVMAGGTPNSNVPTGNDTFVFLANVIPPPANPRPVTIVGTESNFNTAPVTGEINTIEARGNNDFSYASIFWINKIVFNGASDLKFGGGNFFSNDHIAPNSTVVGDSDANTFEVWANPANIQSGHSDANLSPDIDLSNFTFQNWSPNDKVIITADQTNTAGSAIIKAPNVPTIIKGGPQAFGDQLFGGSANDQITGGINDDILRGNGGNDTLDGGSGNDTLRGDAGKDIIKGGSGNDALRGDDANDTLDGGSGNDTLRGDAGKDILVGGKGLDILTGGFDADRFDFNDISETKSGNNRDTIKDFSRGQNDKIDLEDIDANTKNGGNQKFSFIGVDKFSGKAGELRYNDHGSKVTIQGDVNGDGKVDFEIRVDVGSLVKGDFIL